MQANAFEIVWRNPLPKRARPVAQAAGWLKLVKTPESQPWPRSIGWFVFYCSRARIGVAKLSQALRILFGHGGTVVHMQKNRNAAAFTSSAVAVNALEFRREMYQLRGRHDNSDQS